MTDDRPRLTLPRKLSAADNVAGGPRATVVVPDYGDDQMAAPTDRPNSRGASRERPPAASPQRQTDPFEGFGDRLASRPFALRLPRPVDLVIRQIAAENQVQPLRVVDQAVRDYLARLGRLPEMPDA